MNKATEDPRTIAILIPTAVKDGPDGRPLLRVCLESVLPAVKDHPPQAASRGVVITEVILITQGRRFEDPILDELAAFGVGVRQIDVLGRYNFSRKNNAGAAAASADYLLLLNDDVTFEDANWPLVFAAVLSRTRVGAVGPLIWNPDGTLNSAGDTYGDGTLSHVDSRWIRQRPGAEARLDVDCEVRGLTAAVLMLRRDTYVTLGGLDESLANSFQDGDFCLRLEAAGLKRVLTPRVNVVHAESATRNPVDGIDREFLAILAKHPEIARPDPTLPRPSSEFISAQSGPERLPLLRSLYRATARRILPRPARDFVRHRARLHLSRAAGEPDLWSEPFRRSDRRSGLEVVKSQDVV